MVGLVPFHVYDEARGPSARRVRPRGGSLVEAGVGARLAEIERKGPGGYAVIDHVC
jgi:hypothetical protein